MDHAMDYIEHYMYSDVNELKTEYNSNKYTKLSECPSYVTVKAYCEAYNVLARVYYNTDEIKKYLISPKKVIEEME